MFISCMHLFCESSVISTNSRFFAVHYLAAAFPTPLLAAYVSDPDLLTPIMQKRYEDIPVLGQRPTE